MLGQNDHHAGDNGEKQQGGTITSHEAQEPGQQRWHGMTLEHVIDQELQGPRRKQSDQAPQNDEGRRHRRQLPVGPQITQDSREVLHRLILLLPGSGSWTDYTWPLGSQRTMPSWT